MAKLAKPLRSSKPPEKKVQVASDISITQQQEKDLVEYIIKRFEFAQQIRDQFVMKLERIDREFAGFVRLDQEDAKRKRDTEQGQGIKPYDVNLPFVDVQIDEAVTLLMSILAPDSDLYGAITTREKQEITNGIVRTMNEHADDFQHYDQLCLFITNSLKYNASAAIVDWIEVIGRKLVADETAGRKVINDVVKRGSEVETVDMYNFMWDVSKPFLKLASEGEFFATFDTETLFRIDKMKLDNEIFNCERFLKEGGPQNINMLPTYYKYRPDIATRGIDPNSQGPVDFTSVLTLGLQQSGMQHMVEKANIYIWIDPTKFGLEQKSANTEGRYEIWKFMMINNKYIVAAERIETAYGMLPIVTSMPRNDGFGLQTQSQAELLMPFQRFSSHQFNVHQRAARTALYGKTFYDSRAIPEKVTDTEAGWIPVKLSGLLGEVDIRKMIMHISDQPETRFIMDDIGKVNDLMQKILPTDLLKQVTDLQRATEYQAAAVVQGSNRRGHKMAKVIDDQAFTQLRFMQFINIIHHEATVNIINDQGQEVPESPAPALDMRVQFSISGGLRGLDKMYVIAFYKEMFQSIVQSGKAQEVDILGLLDYIAGLVGDKMDITQFKHQTQFDMLPPDQKDMAFQLLQQAGNAGAAPAGQAGPPAINGSGGPLQ